ncbi:chorismate synthase [Planctomycetales bacterium]|nr:chorismate synthase [Planctomycetales bacterium]
MANSYGQNFRVTIFGQSHSEAMGAVLDGLPAGVALDLDAVAQFMRRRAPGRGAWATARQEDDAPQIVSGLADGKTCGAPLTALIANRDQRSGDYADLRDLPRPAHADFTAAIKFHGANDIRGGGQFSGRLTAPLVFAGAVAMQILAARGVKIAAHIFSIADVADAPLSPLGDNRELLFGVAAKNFPALDDAAGVKMQNEIAAAKAAGDSVGGVVEGAAFGVPAGVGEPPFRGVENVLAQILWAIPAVRGVEFGAGFAATQMRGSRHNDEFYYAENGAARTRTNHHGGVLGGIASGMPLIVRAAFKPTPSIAREQNTISLSRRAAAKLVVKGRHDPCIVPRVVPVVEAAMAVGLLDLLSEGKVES